MQLSIIIPCKNESGVVNHLLDDLVAQRRQAPYQVIVVDSQSTDDTIKQAKTYRPRLPIITTSAQKKGVAEARNWGRRQATGDMLLFLDADCRLSPDFIEKFMKFHQRAGAESGGFTQRIASKSVLIRGGGRMMNGYLRLMQYTPWPIAFTCIYSSPHVFDNLKGFDPALFVMEDYDYVLRARRAGYRVHFCPVPFISSDRRYVGPDRRSIWQGVYAELYRYTHGLRITRPLFRYEMGGAASPTHKGSGTVAPSDEQSGDA